MKIERVDELAQEAASRYRTFSLAIRGLYETTVAGRGATFGGARQSFQIRAHELLSEHARREKSITQVQTDVLTSESVSDAYSDMGASILGQNTSVSILSATMQAMSDMLELLESQLSKDASAAKKALRDFAIKVDILRQQRGWSMSASQIAVRESTKSPKFQFIDRAGRRWNSERYVHNLIRNHYLSVYNESYILAALSLGQDTLTLRAPEKPDLAFRIMDSSENLELPTYGDLIDRGVLHPQSNYLVGKR